MNHRGSTKLYLSSGANHFKRAGFERVEKERESKSERVGDRLRGKRGGGGAEGWGWVWIGGDGDRGWEVWIGGDGDRTI